MTDRTGVRRRQAGGNLQTEPGLAAHATGDYEHEGRQLLGDGPGAGSLSGGSCPDAVACRCRGALDWVVAVAVLAQPALALLASVGWPLPALPGPVTKALIILGGLLLGRALLRFRRWRDETSQVPRFLACFLVMLAELTIENCAVWLVSATDQRKYELVPGLQDNVELAVRAAAAASPSLAAALALPAATVLHFLAALLALAFSVLWDQVPYSGFGIFSRAVLTIAASRVLRMACFMCTVLPNPRPGCYGRRFPPVPATVWETIKAGYTTIRGFGGCNDLIFSGHGAFWVLAPLAFRTYYPAPPRRLRLPGGLRSWPGWLRRLRLPVPGLRLRLSTAVLWLALAHASVRDVLDRQHYSVDMLLAVVVTWAVWDWLEWVYPAGRAVLPRRAPGSPPDPLNPAVLGLILVCLGVAGVIVIGGKA
ncbi:hypothetical protein HYH02_005702 [Chlamydomonas schloesseri]|uniref:Sphingomyelin synthase-like domain-containing protein n=1 Tax=Chlamydomonas schloesseri TaxID=2026947 RepID=A0A835WK66_9CHLO|nr:hypothetical protein HYH02_005702 [Chlamydomonas schloesseri]|eukprot:KAG2448945.1 hypothetical protein HYH02_005702 [Chlamydomonas schloesseri]